MSYITYAYYTDTFHGSKLSASNFDEYALRASATIDQLCFDRVADIIDDGTETEDIEKIKLATCAVADALLTSDGEGSSGEVQSESVGQYSVTYVAGSTKSPTRKLQDTAKLYLGRTGLMFPGFYIGEYGHAH